VIWSKKINRTRALGVFTSSLGTALAVIEGARDSCLRVIDCALLSPDMTISDYVGANSLRNSVCVDVLSASKYDLQQVELQGLKPEEKREAARWQIRELINYPADEAVLDLIEVPIIGEDDKSRTFVVAARLSDLKAHADELRTGNLHLEAIDIPEFALRNLLELYRDETHGNCLLWIRNQTSLMVICRGETLFFSRSINIGIEQLHEENISTADGQLSENFQSLLDGIVLEVQRSLDYCESNFHLPPVFKILVAVCGEESVEIVDYLDRYLEADVQFADFRQVLDLPIDLDPATINACLPALGAALRAGGRG
jgi:MSHA biogenesis protein MshI